MLVRKDWPFLFLLLCLDLTLNVVVLFFLTWKNLLDTNSVKTRSGKNEREKEVQEFLCFQKLGWLEWIIARAKTSVWGCRVWGIATISAQHLVRSVIMPPHYWVLYSSVMLSILFSGLGLGKTWKCSYFGRIVNVFQKGLFSLRSQCFQENESIYKRFSIIFPRYFFSLARPAKISDFFFLFFFEMSMEKIRNS